MVADQGWTSGSIRGVSCTCCSGGGQEKILVPYELTDLIKEASECHLLLEFSLREDTLWAKKGFRIGWEQIPIPTNRAKSKISSGRGTETTPLIIHPRDNLLEILIPGTKLTFDTDTGFLQSLEVDGVPILMGGLIPNFQRALDNDFIVENIFPRLGRLISLNWKWEGARASMKLKRLPGGASKCWKCFDHRSLPDPTKSFTLETFNPCRFEGRESIFIISCDQRSRCFVLVYKQHWPILFLMWIGSVEVLMKPCRTENRAG